MNSTVRAHARLLATCLALGMLVDADTSVGGASPLPRPVSRGYLLYPRQAFCATPARPASSGVVRARQVSAGFRLARTAAALMPPALGQHLTREQIIGTSRPLL